MTHSPGRSPLATHDPIMEIFSPLKDVQIPDVMESVPRSTHQPLTGSKLEYFVDRSEIENDGYVELNELEKSPTRDRSSCASVSPLESQDKSRFRFQPISVNLAKEENNEPLAKETVLCMAQTTPIQLGKTRSIDVPSSLEKFKSLRIGIDSINQTLNATKFSSPIKQNSFGPSKLPDQSDYSIQSTVIKGIIEEALSEFKATVRNDIQNLHVEVLRQAIYQQNELRTVLDEYLPPVKELMDELRRLRDENERLRLRLYGNLK